MPAGPAQHLWQPHRQQPGRPVHLPQHALERCVVQQLGSTAMQAPPAPPRSLLRRRLWRCAPAAHLPLVWGRRLCAHHLQGRACCGQPALRLKGCKQAACTSAASTHPSWRAPRVLHLWHCSWAGRKRSRHAGPQPRSLQGRGALPPAAGGRRSPEVLRAVLQEVNPEMGSWADVDAFAQNYDVTMELMVNHISPASAEVRPPGLHQAACARRRAAMRCACSCRGGCPACARADSACCLQFQDFLKHGSQSKFADMYIDWDKFWPGGAPIRCTCCPRAGPACLRFNLSCSAGTGITQRVGRLAQNVRGQTCRSEAAPPATSRQRGGRDGQLVSRGSPFWDRSRGTRPALCAQATPPGTSWQPSARASRRRPC